MDPNLLTIPEFGFLIELTTFIVTPGYPMFQVVLVIDFKICISVAVEGLGDAILLGVALVAAGEGAVGSSRETSNTPSPLRLSSFLTKSRASPARGEGGTNLVLARMLILPHIAPTPVSAYHLPIPGESHEGG